MKKNTEHLSAILNEIEKRPAMFSVDDFKSLKSLLMGYLMAMEDEQGFHYTKELCEWIAKDSGSGLYWTAFIYYRLANEDEKEAYRLTFVKLHQFIHHLENVGN